MTAYTGDYYDGAPLMGDELMEGQDLVGHDATAGPVRSRTSFLTPQQWAWALVVLSVFALWLFGGFVFKGVNI